MPFATIPEVEINMSLKGAARWEPLKPYADRMRGMIDLVLEDSGMRSDLKGLVERLTRKTSLDFLEDDLHGLAHVVGIPRDALLAANLYYDSLKLLWACTAFAINTPDGPMQARNLDWEANGLRMSEASLAFRYYGAGRDFLSVGWPGMLGILSATAPGRFCVTLNAVRSDTPSNGGNPVVFLLRQVMEEANDFDRALAILTTRPIASDCILLLTGTKPDQMVVIERTPTDAAVIRPTDGAVVAANHYRKLTGSSQPLGRPDDEREQTSHVRHNRLDTLLASPNKRPQTVEACLAWLRDPELFMDITVQQMVFQPSTAHYTAQMIHNR